MIYLDPTKRYGIIADIHTKLERFGAIVDKYDSEVDHWIQLGDWFDAFKHMADAWDVAGMLKAKLNDPKWTVLWGNHDVHYYAGPKCSGYGQATQAAVWDCFNWEDWEQFHLGCVVQSPKPEVRDLLVTHAGVTARAWEQDVSLEVVSDEIITAEKDIHNTFFRHELLQAGYSRGGVAPYGGVYWADWSEHTAMAEFDQVVGHTYYRGDTPLHKEEGGGQSWCLDNALGLVGFWENGRFSYEQPFLGEDQ